MFQKKIFLLILLLSSMVVKSQVDSGAQMATQIGQSVKKFERSIAIIDKYYVDTVNTNLLVEQAIIAMLKELDPHSNYFTKEQIKRANEDLEGSFEGIGIEFQMINDTILVMGVNKEGPSAKGGLLAGDRIISVDSANATGKSINTRWVSQHLRGEKGSTVQLAVVRPRIDSITTLTIIRDNIPTYSVETFFMLDEATGYIKVTRFMRTTMPEFEKAAKALKKEGMENMVLDLRGNTGGYLNSAVQLADQFLGKNHLIVYTEGINSERIDYLSNGKGIFKTEKLVVLIDEKSASASEIVTGAIQDWDRGIVIGRRSYGKGLVQKPYKLPDGSVIRLTIARYHTPVGRCIQRPYDKGRDKYYEELNEKIKKGVYNNIDSINMPDSLKYTTPNGRVVYGGGGIMPDIIVPGDTAQTSTFIQSLHRKNLFTLFALHIAIEKGNEILSHYLTVTDFENRDDDLDPLADQMISFAASHGVIPSEDDDHVANMTEVKYAYAVALSRFLYGVPSSIYLTRERDPDIRKALEVIRDASSDRNFKISQESL